jgi:2',3'-cyclic-nucleotide 2'-phosphodiesterase (5'-nucleotidase family)
MTLEDKPKTKLVKEKRIKTYPLPKELLVTHTSGSETKISVQQLAKFMKEGTYKVLKVKPDHIQPMIQAVKLGKDKYEIEVEVEVQKPIDEKETKDSDKKPSAKAK